MLIIQPRRFLYSVRPLLAHAWNKWTKVEMESELLRKARPEPVIMKLEGPEFRSIFTPELNTLAEVFKKSNYELRIAGGAVRDLLMGLKPVDIDFATDATPDQMKEMFEAEGIRMINNRGEKHGTVTPRIADKENFEVTTLRIDVVTNGRRADVEFTTDWKLDAYRRDLTINSMFLDLDGSVIDFFYGYEDLMKKRVAFVGNPKARIQEDYLRILRYFRFYGRIAEQPNAHEDETIAAIKENISGLEMISGERIWSEWSKILCGNHAYDLTLKMLECGISSYVGLPEKPDIENFEIVYKTSAKINTSLRPVSLIASMLKTEEEVMNLHARLKLSVYDRDLALFLVRYREDKLSEEPLMPYKRILVHWKGKSADGKAFVCELLKYKGLSELAVEFETLNIPRFPINGHMLKPHIPNGKMFSLVIMKLKNLWLDKNYDITTEELLREVPRIVSELEDRFN